jgi:hypothetical protein
LRFQIEEKATAKKTKEGSLSLNGGFGMTALENGEKEQIPHA